MMYLASLQEETKYKVEGYKFIHTKSELDRIAVDNLNSNRVVIKQDFAHEYFTPSGLASYVENVRRMNFNIIIELDIDGEIITRDKLIAEMDRCRNTEELLMLLGAHEKEFMDTLKYLIAHDNERYSTMLQYSNQVSRLQSVIENKQSEIDECKYVIATQQANMRIFFPLISIANFWRTRLVIGL